MDNTDNTKRAKFVPWSTSQVALEFIVLLKDWGGGQNLWYQVFFRLKGWAKWSFFACTPFLERSEARRNCNSHVPGHTLHRLANTVWAKTWLAGDGWKAVEELSSPWHDWTVIHWVPKKERVVVPMMKQITSKINKAPPLTRFLRPRRR